MKSGPENSADIVSLKAYLHMLKERSVLLKKAAELKRAADDMVWLTMEFLPKSSAYLLTDEEIDKLTLESYNNLRPDVPVNYYCECNGCINGTGCRMNNDD